MAQALQTAALGGSARARAVWILDPGRDLLLFIATPLLILPAAALAGLCISAEDLGLYVAAFGALGHHLPGLMRAYGDRELFRRFRLRFVAAPVFFTATSLFFAHRDLGALVVITLLWGIWHGLAQTYGFCRIYDAKVGSSAVWTAWLDRWMCILWFGAGVLHAPDRVARILEEFYAAGGPLLPAAGLQSFVAAWTAATALVSLAFCANWLWQRAHGRAPSSAKLLLLASSFGFWWYATAGIDNAILGVALFEVFHDVQYLAITWVYNRRSVAQGRDVGPLTRFLFRPRGALLALYVALVFAYGYAALLARSTELEGVKLTLLGLVSASTFLHFYYDSFIWNVREKATRDGLGVAGGEPGARRWSLPARALQAARWSLFLVPAALLGAAQLRGLESPKLERYRSLAALVPDEAKLRVALGNLLYSDGRLDEALAEYRAASRLAPDDAEAFAHLGDVYRARGDAPRALESYGRALALEPARVSARTGAGIVLQGQGDVAGAARAFEQVLAAEPGNAAAHSNLGAMRHAEGDLARAAFHYERALAADPGLGETHNNLGVLLEERGDLAGAASHFESAVRLTPSPVARENLSRVRAQRAAGERRSAN